MRTGGALLTSGHLKGAVMDLAPLRTIMADELVPLELWLAKRTSAWHKRYVGD